MADITIMRAKKLWIGKTARQWLVDLAVLLGNVRGITAEDSIGVALENSEHDESGSPNREAYDLWENCSIDQARRIVADVRRALKHSDRQAGRNIKR